MPALRATRSPLRPSSVLVTVLLALLAGCSSSGGRPAVAPAPEAAPAAEAPAADAPKLPLEIHWVRNSAEYRAASIQAYRFAGLRLEELAAGRQPGTWAVALDADETVISNGLFEKEMFLAGETFGPEVWQAWVARHEAPPLPGARAFLERVRELGGKIAIVTNRDDHLCPDTEVDFRKFEIPFDVMLCRVDGESEKEPRWRMVEEGTASPDLPPLEIVMWLGDNIQDFPRLDQDLRLAPEPAFSAFGVEYFVLPNPMYGSWRDNPPD